jgi:hypothetical protein
LEELHEVLQAVVGWENCHLHAFGVGARRFGPSNPYDALDDDLWKDERAVRLDSLLKRSGSKLRYVYDMGDNWEHTVVLEKVLPLERGRKYPVCLEGELACPPEDCGGIWGYEKLKALLKNPGRKDPDDLREWMGDWTPDSFDVRAVNRDIKRYCRVR